jgi:hypothetical protein
MGQKVAKCRPDDRENRSFLPLKLGLFSDFTMMSDLVAMDRQTEARWECSQPERHQRAKRFRRSAGSAIALPPPGRMQCMANDLISLRHNSIIQPYPSTTLERLIRIRGLVCTPTTSSAPVIPEPRRKGRGERLTLVVRRNDRYPLQDILLHKPHTISTTTLFQNPHVRNAGRKERGKAGDVPGR